MFGRVKVIKGKGELEGLLHVGSFDVSANSEGKLYRESKKRAREYEGKIQAWVTEVKKKVSFYMAHVDIYREKPREQVKPKEARTHGMSG